MNWVQPKFSDFLIPPAKKQKTKCANLKKIKCHDQCPEEFAWLNKWKPKKKSDLVVHKKKVEEVEKWLEDTKKKCNSFILLLYGPPGCGKLTTLKVLSNECGVNVVEWLPQVALSSYNPESVSHVPYQSEISIFEEFVMRATRYSNVINRNSCRLIVVKDIPLQFSKDASLFNDFLFKYSNIVDVNLVFIITDFKTMRELFSDEIKSKYGIKTIQFNPITQRNTLTALQKITKGKFSEYLTSVSLSSAGDLRNAITTLHFLSVKGALPQKKNQEYSRSDSLDIFHGIGRVLYAKREEGKLKHCPIDLAESFISSPDLFVNMLHENYLGTFSSMHEIAKASNFLTKSDLLLKPMGSSTFSLAAISIASFALMFYNSTPVKKFQQFNRPSRICNHLNEYRSISKDAESLIDIVSYGRVIPSFAASHSEMFQKLRAFEGPCKNVPINIY